MFDRFAIVQAAWLYDLRFSELQYSHKGPRAVRLARLAFQPSLTLRRVAQAWRDIPYGDDYRRATARALSTLRSDDYASTRDALARLIRRERQALRLVAYRPIDDEQPIEPFEPFAH